MKNTTFLIETLKRTLEELDRSVLSTEEKVQLTTMVEKEHFIKLFGISEEVTTQLTERALSELTDYQFNSVYAGVELVGNFDWVISKDGSVVVRRPPHSGSNHWVPPVNHFVFRLIDEGRNMLSEETNLLIIRIEDTRTKEVFSVNFEVIDTLTGYNVFRMIERYLPGHYKASTKKL